MFKTASLTALLLICAGNAHASFSLVCDEKAQLDEILSANQDKGFDAAREKFLAFVDLRNEHGDPTCELSEPPQPERVGQVVSHYESIEFLPEQLHDVIVVEIRVGEHFVFGTINRFVGEKDVAQVVGAASAQ